MNDVKTSHQIGEAIITPECLTAIELLQSCNNEILHEHIMRLGMATAWIGLNLDGFDPDNKDDQQALKSIVTISQVIFVLQKISRP